MNATRRLARVGGLLYLIVAVGGGFAELFVRARMIVPGDAAATAANIVHDATLFRLGFVADLVDFTCFLLVGLVLYAILKPVNPHVAVAMLTINAVSVAIQALNMLNQVGALLVATDPGVAPGMSSLFFLELHHQGYLIAQIFFGGYLVPLGYLVYESRLFPRWLGGVLMVGGVGYLAGIAASWLSPSLVSPVATDFGMVGGLAETAFLLWLLVIGPRATSPADTPRRMEGALSWK